MEQMSDVFVEHHYFKGRELAVKTVIPNGKVR